MKAKKIFSTLFLMKKEMKFLKLIVLLIILTGCDSREEVNTAITVKEAKRLIEKYKVDSSVFNPKFSELAKESDVLGEVSYKDFEEFLKLMVREQNSLEFKLARTIEEYDYQNKSEEERSQFLKELDVKYGTNYSKIKTKEGEKKVSYLVFKGVKYVDINGKRILDSDKVALQEEFNKLGLTKEIEG